MTGRRNDSEVFSPMTDKQEKDVELGETHSPEPSLRKVHTLMLKHPSHRAALPGSDDYGYDESHYFELEEGENWLRLSQTESRHSILDDTQDFSQDSNNWFASILSLSSVGESVNVSNNCYLCLDVDGKLMAMKDMRPPSSKDDYPPLGLSRANRSDWELLPRRQLRILQPGDRICTAYEQGSPNGLVMEYQYRRLSTAKLLDSQRNALDLLTQPMEDDDEDAEETQTEPTPTCNVQIVETQNYDSDSTAEMTQSQVALSGQPSLGLSTQPKEDDDSDSAKQANNHHPHSPEPPSAPCGSTIVVQKKQDYQNIPSPIAEVDEGVSQEDITQKPVITTITPIVSDEQKFNEGDDLVYSVTPKSTHENMNIESMHHHETEKEVPSHQGCDGPTEEVIPNQLVTVPQQHHDPAPSNTQPRVQTTESNCSEKLNQVSDQQQNCNVSMDAENIDETTNTIHRSSQNENPHPSEVTDHTKDSHQNVNTHSNEEKDIRTDPTVVQSKSDDMPSKSTHEQQGSTYREVPNDSKGLDQSVDGRYNAAPSHDAVPSQDISMSMLRETGEETPLEGLNATNNEDEESDVTDDEIMDRPGQNHQSPITTKQHQNVNLANNDNDSEITEVDDVVPRKEPQKSVNVLHFPPVTKDDDDSDITEIDVHPVLRKAKEMAGFPKKVLQTDNTANDDDGNKTSHVDEVGQCDQTQVTNQVEGKGVELSMSHGDETTGTILTPIAHTIEAIQEKGVHVSDTNKADSSKLCLERTDAAADLSVDKPGVEPANDDQSYRADSPKLCIETRDADADRSVDKPEVEKANDKQSSNPAETVDGNISESTDLDPKSDCHTTNEAHDEKPQDGVDAPLESDSNDEVRDEQEKIHNNPSPPCQTVDMERVDGEVEGNNIRFDGEDIQNTHDANTATLVPDRCSNKTDVTEEQKSTPLEKKSEANTGRDGKTSEVDQERLLMETPRKSKRKLRAEAYDRAVEGMVHDKLQVRATRTKRLKQAGHVTDDATNLTTALKDSTPQDVESTDETPLQHGKRRRMSKRMNVVLNDVSSPPAPASVASSPSSSTWSTRKRARGTPPAWNSDENPPIRVMATNVEIDSKGKQMVKKIGGVFIEKIEDAVKATHVIAASKDVKLKRTPKFMVAISRTSNIVHLDWLIESARKGEALDAQEFLLLDQTEAESQYNFKLSETLARGNTLRDKGTLLLDGIDVFLCNGVAGSVRKGDKTPPETDFRLILEAAGASVLTTLPTQRSSGKSKTIIITSKDPKERKKQLSKRDVMTAVKQGAVPKTAEEIFHAIMTQDFKI